MSKVNVNTVAKYKVITNKRLNTVKVLVAFSHTDRFTQRQCAYVSGDLYTAEDVTHALQCAARELRTNNIIEA